MDNAVDDIDPYRPPQSQVSALSAGEGISAIPAYFTVGTLKLTVMSICTFGVYELYWFYRNWKLIRDRDHTDISPVWRAFFAPFWGFSLAAHIRDHADTHGIAHALRPAAAGGLYLVLSALAQLPDPYWLISILNFLPLLLIQNVAEDIGKATTLDERSKRLSAWNWVGIVAGGLFLLLIITDLLLLNSAL